MILCFVFSCYGHHRDLHVLTHPFPPRRSSDLSNAVDMVAVDSVAALTPRAEIEGEMGDQLPGLQARLMSQALRKLTGNIKRSNCMVFFINQQIGRAHV